MTRTRTRLMTLRPGLPLTLIGLGLAACGSGTGTLNGEQSKSAAEVVADAGQALASARSVHVVGDSTSDGQKAHVDLRLTGANAVGTISTGTTNLSLVTVGSTAYVKGYGAQLSPAVAAKLRNRWIKQSTTSGQGALTIEAISTSLTRSFTPTGAVTRSKLHGRPVVIVHGTDQGEPAAIWVANTGPAYPLRLVGTSTGSASLNLSDYGAPVHVTRPTSALDASQVAKLINGS